MNALTTPLCALLGIEVPIVQAQAGVLHVHTVGSVPEARHAVENLPRWRSTPASRPSWPASPGPPRKSSRQSPGRPLTFSAGQPRRR